MARSGVACYPDRRQCHRTGRFAKAFEAENFRTVHDDKLDERKRRRQIWFMQGKEGKQYKATSLYQFMRRLGFFPTEVCRRPVSRCSLTA